MISDDIELFPIFVGGTGRSGTTIFKKIFACHSKVLALPDELRVIVDPGGALDLMFALTDHWSPYTADNALIRFRELMRDAGRAKTSFGLALEKGERLILRKAGVSPRRYAGMGLAYHFQAKELNSLIDDLLARFAHHVSRGSWAGSPGLRLRSKIYEVDQQLPGVVERELAIFFATLYKRLDTSGNKTHWVEDTPNNILYAADLLRIFPPMKLIHIYRDPRDVVSSYHRFSWGGENFTIIARRIAGIYSRWQQVKSQLPADAYQEVSLEQLSANPQIELEKICSFLKLDFEPALLSIPLNQVHAGRWKKEIPAKEAQQVTEMLKSYIELLGYQLD